MGIFDTEDSFLSLPAMAVIYVLASLSIGINSRGAMGCFPHCLLHAMTQDLKTTNKQTNARCPKQSKFQTELSSLSAAGRPTFEMYTFPLSPRCLLWDISWWKARGLHLPVFQSPFCYKNTVTNSVSRMTSLWSLWGHSAQAPLASLSSDLPGAELNSLKLAGQAASFCRTGLSAPLETLQLALLYCGRLALLLQYFITLHSPSLDALGN